MKSASRSKLDRQKSAKFRGSAVHSRVPARMEGSSSPTGSVRRSHHQLSHHLTLLQVEELLHGAFRAPALDRPLNRFMTLNLEAGTIEQVDCFPAVQRLLKLIADWVRVNGFKLSYLWVQEHGSEVGQHLHLLLHVPADRIAAFNKRQAGWIKRCGLVRTRGLIRSAPIGGTYLVASSADPHTQQVYRANLLCLIDYLLKDACDEARRAHRIEHEGSFGPVIGKRAGVSRDLGRRGATGV